MMSCSHFQDFLEQQPDGPLSAAVAVHVEECASCGALWRDLEIIRDAGKHLGAQETAPPERLWLHLREKLEAEGLIREPVREMRAREQARPGWLAGVLGIRPALAGAYCAALLIAGALVGYVRFGPSPQPAEPAPGRFTPSANVALYLDKTLDGDVQQVMASLPARNPSLTNSLRENLGIVDNLIAVCEKSVREQPQNAMAREYLYRAYQQKAVLLATALDRSTLEDK